MFTATFWKHLQNQTDEKEKVFRSSKDRYCEAAQKLKQCIVWVFKSGSTPSDRPSTCRLWMALKRWSGITTPSFSTVSSSINLTATDWRLNRGSKHSSPSLPHTRLSGVRPASSSTLNLSGPQSAAIERAGVTEEAFTVHCSRDGESRPCLQAPGCLCSVCSVQRAQQGTCWIMEPPLQPRSCSSGCLWPVD